MAKKEKKPTQYKKQTTLYATLIFLAMYILSGIIACAALTPKTYDVGVGTKISSDILATEEITDRAATDLLKERARENAEVKYYIDPGTVKNQGTLVENFFTNLTEIRSKAAEFAGGTQTTEQAWEQKLTSEQKVQLCAMATPKLDDAQLSALLVATEGDLTILSNLVIPKMATAHSNGLHASMVESVKSACVQELNASSLKPGFAGIGEMAIREFLVATYLKDETATELSMQLAENSVKPVVIKRGEVIVPADTAITPAQMEMLNELGLVRADSRVVLLRAGIMSFLLILFAMFYIFMRLCQNEVFRDVKKMLIVGFSVIITVALELLLRNLSAYIIPSFIAVILIAVLVNEMTALSVSFAVSVIVGLMSAERGAEFFSQTFALVTLASLAGGMATVFILRRTNRRSVIIASGAGGGIVSAIAVIAIYIIAGKSIWEILRESAWVMGSGIICAVLCAGMLPVWENLFDIATAARLGELANTNHPLMKQLLLEAPGTYHHSLMVAELAEGAAQRIGADALLCRVGSYYHDVGKLRRPKYFKENQRNGENIHDTLPAQESATAISMHQKDGAQILTRQKMPAAVVTIASEHHGNTLIAYFYHKATQEEGAKEVNQKLYRYGGNRPSSRESAIVMLADSCEAAVRSMGETTIEEIENMVHKTVWGKLDDGQLSNCRLTLLDIQEIEKSFVKTFSGIIHERIEYPDIEQTNGEE